jgi:RND family efflux transporter MFP subunit
MKTSNLLVLAIAVSTLLHSPLLLAAEPASEDKPEVAPKVVSVAPVRSVEVSPQMMVSGQVYSRFQSNLSAGVDGRLDWIAEPGSTVAAGDVLARLDAMPLQLRANELQAQLKRSQINVTRLGKELARLTTLVSKQLISQTQLEQMQADFDLASADVELARASLAQLQDQLSRTVLKAPFAGVVSSRAHQVGEEVSRSETLLQLVNLTDLEVRVFAPLGYASFLTPGQSLPVYRGQGETSLKLTSVIPVSDVRSQTFEARLLIDAKVAKEFQVGQLVSVALPTAAAAVSHVVHRDALVLGKDQHAVFLVQQDAQNKSAENKLATVKRVVVKPGQGQGEWLQVDAPLTSGALLVVRGADTLKDGDKVRLLSDKEFTLAGSQ